MDYKRANRLSNIFTAAGIVLAVSLFFFESIGAAFIILAAAAIFTVAFGLTVKIIYYRCPKCHRGLPLRTLSLPDYCPACGEKLEG